MYQKPNKDKKIDSNDDETKDKFKLFMGARVMWPPDIPDHMLKLCINKSKDLFEKYKEDLATKG